MAKDPFASIDTSAMDQAAQAEREAAKRLGLEGESEPQLESDLEATTTLDYDESQRQFRELKKAKPFLRRDYSKYHELWDQIILAPQTKVFIPCGTETMAKAMRSDFYKARSAFRILQGDTYPEHVEAMAMWRIGVRKGTEKKTGHAYWYLVFEQQEDKIEIQYELPEFD